MTLTVASEDIAGSPEFRHLSSIAGIAIDLRYATPNNFVGRDLYSPFDCAWLHRDAAEAPEEALQRHRDGRAGGGVRRGRGCGVSDGVEGLVVRRRRRHLFLRLRRARRAGEAHAHAVALPHL